MKKYYLVSIVNENEFTENVYETKEEAIEAARKEWNHLFDSDKEHTTLEIKYCDETYDDIDEKYYPDFQNYDAVDWMQYKIHEIETNTTYDDLYDSIEEAEKMIEIYEEEDRLSNREKVTYEILDIDNEIMY